MTASQVSCDSSLTLVDDLDTLMAGWQPPDEYEQVWEQHDDHQDEVEELDVWSGEEFQWVNDMTIHYSDRNFQTNNQLYDDPITRHWMQKLTAVRKGGYYPLDIWIIEQSFRIPLFVDNKGLEYQVAMCYRGTGGLPHIPQIRCPLLLPDSADTARADCLFKLKCRLPVSTEQTTILPPTYAFYLGMLFIKHRYNHPCPIVEKTDYSVVVDAESAGMAVWIVASRKELRSRPANIEPLPIFDGLMAGPGRGSEGHHDIACILDTVRRIGSAPSEYGAPDFEESCELVRRSRAIVDPAALLQPRQKLFAFLEENSIPSEDARSEYQARRDEHWRKQRPLSNCNRTDFHVDLEESKETVPMSQFYKGTS